MAKQLKTQLKDGLTSSSADKSLEVKEIVEEQVEVIESTPEKLVLSIPNEDIVLLCQKCIKSDLDSEMVLVKDDENETTYRCSNDKCKSGLSKMKF